ncbi:MAG: adenylate kinase, partial [Acidimicrobiia bacterium]|nr:adenylate kinase [Acidimicrobiia bacterium]
SGRRTCPNQHVYHIDDNPPETPGVCDVDGEALVQRDDDAEDVVRNRLVVYREQTEPLVEFYASRGLRIHPVNGLGDLDEIEAAIAATLDI